MHRVAGRVRVGLERRVRSAGLERRVGAQGCGAPVCVAENRPVRRCLGSRCRMALSVASKPMSRSLPG